MRDQADRLRQVIDNLKARQTADNMDSLHASGKKAARVIAVTSGKGGVGKTNIAINIAIALGELGLRIILLANVDVLLGIVPKYTLADVIQNKKNILEVLSAGPKNIKFLSGGSGVEELLRLEREQLENFMGNVTLLDRICDIILIDTSAGLSDYVMSFVMASDEVLLVTTPEPTSITDAYALIKIVSKRDRNKVIKVIVNRADNEDEAYDVLNKLLLVSKKFLKIDLYPLGYILKDESGARAVKMQQPFSIAYPKCDAAKRVREISKKLADIKSDAGIAENPGIRRFVNRLVGFLSP